MDGSCNGGDHIGGELGFMKLILGENQLGIEQSCAFAIPGTWSTHNKNAMKMVVIAQQSNKKHYYTVNKKTVYTVFRFCYYYEQ